MKSEFTNGKRVDVKCANGLWLCNKASIERYDLEGFYVVRFQDRPEAPALIVQEDDLRVSSALVVLLNAGHRERAFGFELWKSMEPREGKGTVVPFWKFLEMAHYDPVTDEIVFGLHKNRVESPEEKKDV